VRFAIKSSSSNQQELNMSIILLHPTSWILNYGGRIPESDFLDSIFQPIPDSFAACIPNSLSYTESKKMADAQMNLGPSTGLKHFKMQVSFRIGKVKKDSSFNR
jgi:hypothetical protein